MGLFKLFKMSGAGCLGSHIACASSKNIVLIFIEHPVIFACFKNLVVYVIHKKGGCGLGLLLFWHQGQDGSK